MQQVADSFLLHHLSGSETPEQKKKRKKRAAERGESLPAAAAGSRPRRLGPLNRLKSAESQPADPSRMTSSFYLCYLLLLAVGVACVTSVCYWIVRWRGGFAWDGTHQQFNWHPALMVTGLLVLYGYGAVLYRVPLTWAQPKLRWKLLHATLMLLALLLSVVGLCAVFGFHRAENIPNVYSLHSWIGIATTALFALQWVAGAAVFLLPCSPASVRRLLKPVHVWLGGSILSLSVVACVSGINEKLFFALKGGANASAAYSGLPPEAVFANSLGVLLVAFGMLALLVLSNRRWRRPEAAPEEAAYAPLRQEDN